MSHLPQHSASAEETDPMYHICSALIYNEYKYTWAGCELRAVENRPFYFISHNENACWWQLDNCSGMFLKFTTFISCINDIGIRGYPVSRMRFLQGKL